MNLGMELLNFIPILVLFGAAFSGSEIALLSADLVELKKKARKGHYGAKLALALRDKPERILSTTLPMTTLSVVGISILVELSLNSLKLPAIASIAMSSGIVILFCELIPKTLFQRNADTLAPVSSILIHYVYRIFLPATAFFTLYTTRLTKLIEPIGESISGRKKTIRDELLTMVTRDKKETAIRTSEKRIIKRIFDFKDTEARHSLIPLAHVNAVEENSTVKEAIETFIQFRHSRLPVFSDRVFNIIGVLQSNDLLNATRLEEPIKNYIRPIEYVAETQTLEDVLGQMRRRNIKMTIVVDEHGAGTGILTPEDIVEEIVGEIHDETDRTFIPYKELAKDRYLCQGRAQILLLNEQLGLDLPEGDFETISGFLLQQFGRIPETGDELHFETPSGSYRFTIRLSTPRRIESVLIEKIIKS